MASTRTMRAAVCNGAGQPLTVENVPIPEPTGRMMLVKVIAASLCHSDLGIVSNKMGAGIYPIIIGHEAICKVEKLGPEASSWGFKVGDLVGAPLWSNMCLECSDCKQAGPQFCPTMSIKGLTCDGFFCEYTLLDPASSVVIPPEFADRAAELAPLFCAGITIWDALEHADIKMGQTVAIVGAGGLGQLAVQFTHELGARVIAMDIRDEQLQACKSDGTADVIINTKGLQDADVAAKIKEANDGRLVDVVIVCSGVVPAYDTAFQVVKTCGRVVAVGLPYKALQIFVPMLSSRCIELIGAKVPGAASAQRCLDFTLRKGLFSKTHPRKFQLEDLNEMMELMEAGKVDEGRMVVRF